MSYYGLALRHTDGREGTVISALENQMGHFLDVQLKDGSVVSLEWIKDMSSSNTFGWSYFWRGEVWTRMPSKEATKELAAKFAANEESEKLVEEIRLARMNAVSIPTTGANS